MSRLQLNIISIKINIALSVINQRWIYICMVSPVNFSRVQSLFFGIHNTNDVKQTTLLLVIQWCILLFELVRSLLLHYSDVKWARWRRKSPAQPLFTQPFIQMQIKKTSKLRVTGLCVGKSPGPVNAPHKGPVTRKMFLFDDVIMINRLEGHQLFCHRQRFGPLLKHAPHISRAHSD